MRRNFVRNLIILMTVCGLVYAADQWFAMRGETSREIIADFSVDDIQGKTHHLSDFQSAPLVLHFWASWCAPCIEEMPSLIAAANAHPHVNFLLISADRDLASLHRFMDQMIIKPQQNTLLIHDPHMQITTGRFGIQQLPESLILSPGLIVSRHVVGAGHWEKRIFPTE